MASTIAIYGIAFMCVVFIGVLNLFDDRASGKHAGDRGNDPKIG
jgi:hypothetical protein